MKKMALSELAKHLGIDVESDELIFGYRIDSRFVEIGDLFFALPGARTDGHEYLGDARARGAVAAVVETSYEGEDFGLILLRIDGVEKALQELARFSLSQRPAFVVGVTGSVGKTTTKEFIATLLEGKYTVFKTPGSYNTKLTLPLTVLNRGEEKVLVLEMGISQPGEMEKLIGIAAPDIAVLTKVSLAHAQFFSGGVEEIRQEKMKIFSHPKTKVGIVPDSIVSFLSEAKMVYFSQEDRGADYFLSVADERAYVDEKAVRAFQFDLPFKQPHILHDLLAAIAVCRQMSMHWEEIYDQISKLHMPKMRFEESQEGGVRLINDAYNANPESMRAALSSLPEPKAGGKKIAVLGSMKELGDFSEKSHQEIGLFAQKFVDHLLTFGAEAELLGKAFSEVQKPAEHFVNLEEVARRLNELMRPGDVVLLKGSRGMRLEELLEKISFTHLQGGV
jgi:UDP-N-acetylmuramoyl-tripeptide--D-alanyl-D-alanine ligase